MELAEQIVETIILVIIGAHGLIINSAIITVYIRLWRKITSPGVSDQILFTMAVTNIVLQCSMLFNSYLVVFQIQKEINTNVLFIALYVLFVVFNMSFWNTAWLSIFYCVKLVDVSHWIFLRVKIWFSSSITKLLIGSAICSVWVNLPFFWAAHIVSLHNTNITDEPLFYKVEMNVYYAVFKMLISYTVPFILTLVCIGLSVRSLLQHVWKIRQNVSQVSSSPQIQALVWAAVTMTLRLMLDLTFLIMVTYTSVVSFSLEYVIEMVFCLFLLLYPSVQSFVLIFGNPKLKSGLLGRESTSKVIT